MCGSLIAIPKSTCKYKFFNATLKLINSVIECLKYGI